MGSGDHGFGRHHRCGSGAPPRWPPAGLSRCCTRRRAPALRRCRSRMRREIVLVIGPEGGIDDNELADLTALGATAVQLGPEVLRTATAAAVALGAIGVMTQRWSR